jgi:PD-(D/E)XK nuclease superfamily/Domain of unknown function (DUF2357)
MLSLRRSTAPSDPGTSVLPGKVGTGLHEDTDYLLHIGSEPGARVFVDDVELLKEPTSLFKWRPSFYAGRVTVEVVMPGGVGTRYLLDVSPSAAKSGRAQFDEMVADIRAFDQTLLGGTSSAAMEFGHAGRPGKFAKDILLTRLREHGPLFLAAVEAIAGSPHRSLAAEARSLPLSRIRRLHHSSLQDRRLAAMAIGHTPSPDSLDSLQVSSLTSAPTFDTPANRALLALVRRFRAALVTLQESVKELKLGSPLEEQSARVERRLEDLGKLAKRTHKVLVGALFSEVSSGETSSAGLTQIAAQPTYSRAYRLGCQALSTQIEGTGSSDQLHIAPSWGIYETWCYLQVLRLVGKVTGAHGVESGPRATSAERAITFALGDGAVLEVLFQATFAALKPAGQRTGWSLSRERRPDIVLVLTSKETSRSLVLDAKWRSGRDNVLDAMESAHIYHDSLRVSGAPPLACLLLLPGASAIPELETDAFIHAHGVGAISYVSVEGPGQERLVEALRRWTGVL